MQTLIKFPRTSHLPWSEGCTSDDKIILNLNVLMYQNVVVTEKYDGENCTFTKDQIYARSVSSNGGILRERVKSLWSNIRYLIPEDIRICGENMQWEHSIRYENLESPFYIFSVFDRSYCLSWDDVLKYSSLMEIPTVPIIFEGIFDNEAIEFLKNLDLNGREGYVVRKRDTFKYEDYSTHVAKFVRKDHVQTTKHWTKNLNENGFKNKK